MREKRGAPRRIEQRRMIDDAALAVYERLGCGPEKPDLLRHKSNNPEGPRRVANRPSVQIRVIAVGKLKAPYAVQACGEFAKRIAPYHPLEIVEVKASDGSRPGQAMREEAERIGKHVREDDCVWLLDRGGEALSSEELSRRMAAVANQGTRRMAFIIAGTFGADDSLRERADFVWSLSPLTFLHEWARMIVLEQIYRAAKIARREPYHH